MEAMAALQLAQQQGDSAALEAAPSLAEGRAGELPAPAPLPLSTTVVAPTAAALGLPAMDETSTMGGGTTCTICFTGTKSHAAVPCGHQFACKDCAEELRQQGQTCPMCRGKIDLFIQVHVC